MGVRLCNKCGLRFAQIISLLLFAICLLIPTISFSAQHRMALVIGNAEYDSLTQLRTPVRDAQAISETLSSMGFTVYLAENLAAHQLHTAFQFFSEKAAQADVSLVYFAGHGARINGQNYLFPTDTDLSQEGGLSRAVNLLDVQTLLNRNNTINILLIDSCQDSPNTRTNQKKQFLTPLAPHAPSIGTLVAHSSSSGQAAFDGLGKHSLFTGALLDNIGRPNVDIEEMLRHVRLDVLRNSHGAQLPQTLSSLVSGFSFVPLVPQNHHMPEKIIQSLGDSGFSRKPILNQISSGLRIEKQAEQRSSLQRQICDILPFPKPSGCNKYTVTPVFSAEPTTE